MHTFFYFKHLEIYNEFFLKIVKTELFTTRNRLFVVLCVKLFVTLSFLKKVVLHLTLNC